MTRCGRFLREVAAALPLAEDGGPQAVYAALDWRRLRLRQDQQVAEWTPGANAGQSTLRSA